MPKAHVGEIEINYEINDFTDPWTKPETVLLHHGFARNLRFWYAWVPLLCRHYRVITMDSRGCGKTTVPPEGYPYSLDEFGDDAVGLMDALGVERVHWGGEASGGVIGINVAVRYPERLDSLTLSNTPITPKGALDEDEVRKQGVAHWARASASRRFDLDKLPTGYLEWSIAENNLTPPHVAIAVHKMLSGTSSREVLPKVQAPTLLLAGEDSQIAPLDQVREMERLIPRTKLVVFEGYGQGIAFSNSDACAGEMLKFIKQLSN
jgi:pimeloyl-ACP methyl ester carboxylesterase